MRKNLIIDCISGGVLIIFAAWGWYETSTWTSRSLSGSVSPEVYPRTVFGLICLCGLFIAIRSIIKIIKQKSIEAEKDVVVMTEKYLNLLLIIVATVIYIYGIQCIGFLISTPIFLLAAMVIFGERKWMQMIISSIVGTILLYLFFVVFMHVKF